MSPAKRLHTILPQRTHHTSREVFGPHSITHSTRTGPASLVSCSCSFCVRFRRLTHHVSHSNGLTHPHQFTHRANTATPPPAPRIKNAHCSSPPHCGALPTATFTTAVSIHPTHKHSPHHFKHVKISALALLKMVMHARSGGKMEVMGVMQVSRFIVEQSNWSSTHSHRQFDELTHSP